MTVQSAESRAKHFVFVLWVPSLVDVAADKSPQRAELVLGDVLGVRLDVLLHRGKVSFGHFLELRRSKKGEVIYSYGASLGEGSASGKWFRETNLVGDEGKERSSRQIDVTSDDSVTVSRSDDLARTNGGGGRLRGRSKFGSVFSFFGSCGRCQGGFPSASKSINAPRGNRTNTFVILESRQPLPELSTASLDGSIMGNFCFRPG